MMRLRTRFLAVLAMGMLAAQAPAATIEVNTTDDVVANDDGLCSIREAVASSVRGGVRLARDEAQRTLKKDKADLTTQLPRLRANSYSNPDPIPGVETYPMASMRTIVAAMRSELDAITPEGDSSTKPFWDTTSKEVNDFNKSLDDLASGEADKNDLSYPKTPFLPYVEDAITILTDVLTAIDNELARLKDIDSRDGCDDGSTFDTIQLEDKDYTVSSTLDLSSHITIKGASAEKTVVHAGSAGYPMFSIDSGDQITLSGMTLKGGRNTGDGGAVVVSGQVVLQDMIFRDNRATNGGAVWGADHSGIQATKVKFFDNRADVDGGAIFLGGVSFDGTDVTFGSGVSGDGNQADAAGAGTGMGGAIFAAGTAFEDKNVSVKVTRGSFVGNSAAIGSAIAASGQGVSLSLVNATVARNSASVKGAIYTETDMSGAVTLNNVTMIQNVAAGDGTAGLIVTQSPSVFKLYHIVPRSPVLISVSNTLLAANTSTGNLPAGADADCDFIFAGPQAFLPIPESAKDTNTGQYPAPVANPSFPVEMPPWAGNFNRNYYLDSSLCPGLRWEDSPVNTNFELPAGWSVINTGDPAVPALLNDLDIADGYYLPVYPNDAFDPTENRLVNRGATALEGYVCATDDQRGHDRASVVDSDCDIGSVEYQIGRRADDRVDLFVSETKCIDVVTNDVGDAEYTPGSLVVLASERSSRLSIVPAANVATDCPNPSDIPAGIDAILYTPQQAFRGENILTYALQWQTGPMANDVRGTVSGYAYVRTDVRKGWSSSSLGATGLGWLVPALLLLLRMPRRGAGLAASLLAALVLFFAVVPTAMALQNIIYVNTDRDDLVPVPGDGLCTLREALITARNDAANLTKGDCLNGQEGPDIIELTADADDIKLAGTLIAYGSVTIRCAAAVTTCRVWRDTAVDPSPSANRFRLIQSAGTITIDRVTLEGGYAPMPEEGDSGLGGAIYSTGGISLSKAVFRNNTALAGGAVFLAGLRTNLRVDQTTFVGNLALGPRTANGGGGAVATSASNEHDIVVIASTFLHNGAIAGAGALQLNTLRSVVVTNSTFSGNNFETYFNGGRSFDASFPAPFTGSVATFSPRGAGVLDVSGAFGGVSVRNDTIVDNLSGAYDIDLTPSTPDFQYAVIEPDQRGITVSNSILGNNYDFQTGLLDENCPTADDRPLLPAQPAFKLNFATAYNLYGETPATPSCRSPAASDKSILPSELYNDVDRDVTTTADSTGYLEALADNGGVTQMHRPRDPVPADTAPDSERIIINAGSPQGFIDEDQPGGAMCAANDQRGTDRRAGVRCDRGSFELQQLTAMDDSGYNGQGANRLVYVDVLGNDIGDPTVPILGLETPTPSDCHLGTPDRSTAGQVALRRADGKPCVIVYASQPDRITFLAGNDPTSALKSTSPYIIVYDSQGKLIPSTTPVTFTYEIYDQVDTRSNRATVSVYVINVPPRAYEDRVHLQRGQSVVIHVLANDVDPDPDPACTSPIDYSTLEIVTPPQFGTATVDKVAGTITWVPTNRFNPFTDSIGYRVRDCQLSAVDPEKDAAWSGTGTVTITINHADSSGGAFLFNKDLSDLLHIDWLGGVGSAFIAPLLLVAFRRRPPAGAAATR